MPLNTASQTPLSSMKSDPPHGAHNSPLQSLENGLTQNKAQYQYDPKQCSKPKQ